MTEDNVVNFSPAHARLRRWPIWAKVTSPM